MRSLALAVAATALLAGGCAQSRDVSGASPPSGGAVTPTPLQQRIEQGGRLFASEGCGTCHQIGGSQVAGPNFEHFAGHDVKLAGGGHAVVDEAFLSRALTDPGAPQLAGWDSAPMRAALIAHRLPASPRKAAALAAFIEQIGPEG